MSRTYKCSMYALFVTRHTEAIVQFLPYYAQQVRCDGLHSRGNSVLQIRYAHGLWWHKHFVLHITPCDYFLWGYVKDKVFVPPQPVSIHDLKNRITTVITPDLEGTGLSPRCVPCDEGCIHRTFVGVCHKLVELLFHFY